MKPRAWPGDGLRCLFVDPLTGEGVRDDGRPVEWRYAPKGGRMTAAGLLACAEAEGARRVFLTGAPLSTDWLDDPPPEGWTAAGHFYQRRDPCGRWRSPSKTLVEVRRVAAWFGEGDYSPLEAREAMRMVATLLRHTTRGRVGLMGSPAAVGQALWADSVSGQAARLDAQLDDDTANLIRSTSPQHREEVVGRCFDGCDEHIPPPRSRVPALHYVDGVFMFAACVRELGTAPVGLLDGERYAESFRQQYPHRRARYRVRFRVPADWAGPGLLPVKHPNGSNWHFPNRPGLTGTAWADAAEVHVAEGAGWSVVADRLIRFEEGRPLDTFRDRILRLRELAEGERSIMGGVPGRLASAAFRSMFIRTIGAFNSRGRDRTFVVPAGVDLPAGVTEWETRDNGARVYTTRVEVTGNAAAFVRPELSSQVWGRARARVASKLLTVDPTQLVAVWGDAMYLATDPEWNGDKPGEFRVKARLDGPLSRPKTIGELLRIREKMRNT